MSKTDASPSILGELDRDEPNEVCPRCHRIRVSFWEDGMGTADCCLLGECDKAVFRNRFGDYPNPTHQRGSRAACALGDLRQEGVSCGCG